MTGKLRSCRPSFYFWMENLARRMPARSRVTQSDRAKAAPSFFVFAFCAHRLRMVCAFCAHRLRTIIIWFANKLHTLCLGGVESLNLIGPEAICFHSVDQVKKKRQGFWL